MVFHAAPIYTVKPAFFVSVKSTLTFLCHILRMRENHQTITRAHIDGCEGQIKTWRVFMLGNYSVHWRSWTMLEIKSLLPSKLLCSEMSCLDLVCSILTELSIPTGQHPGPSMKWTLLASWTKPELTAYINVPLLTTSNLPCIRIVTFRWCVGRHKLKRSTVSFRFLTRHVPG